MTKRKKTLIALAVCVLLPAGVGVYYFSCWSKLNCWTREIDINSGETRYRRYWFWMLTDERVEPTWMSEQLDVPEKEAHRDWHLVVTLSPGTSNSPHYIYHGAIYQLHMAEKSFEALGTPDSKKRQVAEAIRDSWKKTRSDSAAGDILNALLWEDASSGKTE